MDDKMTIFYSKFTGNIEGAFSGEVDFDTFCDREEDVKSYCIRKVTELNNDFIVTSSNYKVNLETNKLEIKNQVNITL